MRFPSVLRHPVTPYQAYFPFQQLAAWTVIVTVRPASASLPAAGLAADLRRAVAELDPALPMVEPRTPRTVVERAHANFTLLGWILSAFAVLGLLLSGLGVYGLFPATSSSVRRRSACAWRWGRGRDQVVALMLGMGLRLALLGLGLGLLGALGLGPVLRAAVEVMPVHDPAVVVPILSCHRWSWWPSPCLPAGCPRGGRPAWTPWSPCAASDRPSRGNHRRPRIGAACRRRAQAARTTDDRR